MNKNKKEDKMKVEAELKEMYKVIVGDNGMCMGQYYGEDDWKESYYGDIIEEIVKQMNTEYFNGLPKTFDMELVQVLIYNGKKYDYKILAEYNKYNKETKLKDEVDKFYSLWNSDKYKNERQELINEDKIKKEEQERLEREQEEREKREREFNDYLILKNKYERD
jgi:hypothetical protein